MSLLAPVPLQPRRSLAARWSRFRSQAHWIYEVGANYSPLLLPRCGQFCMVRDKVRIRFSKTGSLRFISHHDLMRCFERMLRRANLPFHSSQGFNPKPRLIFALPLPLGMAGLEEVVDLELDKPLPVEEIHSRLAPQCPSGIHILNVVAIGPQDSARVHHVCYRVPLDETESFPDLSQRIHALLAAKECWIERQRPQTKRVDLRPFLMDLSLSSSALEMNLFVTPAGTARPEEIIACLGLTASLIEGAVIERTAVELCDDSLAPSVLASRGAQS
jgi:radical SAM-linked protein